MLDSTLPTGHIRGVPLDGSWQPLQVATAHNSGASQEQVDALVSSTLARRLPVPQLHEAVLHVLEWAMRLDSPDKKAANEFQRLMFVRGGPGLGKTELGLVMAEALGYKVTFIPSGSCAGNFSRLAIDYEFGGKRSGDLMEKANKLLSDGTPSEKETLQKMLPLQLNEDKTAIDQTKMGEGDDYVRHFRAIRKAVRSVRPDLVSEPSDAGVREVTGTLLQNLINHVKARHEAQAKGGSVPPMIVVLDEFNRYENTDKLWQSLWEVISGNRKECQMEYRDESGNKQCFTFTREDLSDVMMIATGNDESRERGARKMGEAFLDRARTFDIGTMDASAISHRMQQLLMGIPAGTFLKSALGDAGTLSDEQHERLTALMQEHRKGGMKSDEIKNIPALHLALLEQPLEVATGLGRIANGWQWLCDLSSGDLNTKLNISPEQRKQLEKLQLSPRKLKDFILAAQEGAPARAVSFDDMTTAPVRQYVATSAVNIGTRIVDEILHRIDTLQDKELVALCYNKMLHLGILSKERWSKLSAGMALVSEQHKTQLGPNEFEKEMSAEELINCDGLARIMSQKGPLRRSICDALRARFPELSTTDAALVSDAQLLSLSTVLGEALGQNKDKGFHAITARMGDNSKLAFEVVPAHLSDRLGKEKSDLTYEQVLNFDEILTSLLLSGTKLSQQIAGLAQLDTQNNTGKTLHQQTEDKLLPPGLIKALDGTHPHGLCVTSLSCPAGEGSDAQNALIVHISGNPEAESLKDREPLTLIIGSLNLEPKTIEALHVRRNIVYLTQSDLLSNPTRKQQCENVLESISARLAQRETDKNGALKALMGAVAARISSSGLMAGVAGISNESVSVWKITEELATTPFFHEPRSAVTAYIPDGKVADQPQQKIA